MDKSSSTQESTDLIIRVDHMSHPVYPDCMKKLIHPELEYKEPVEYDLSKIFLWYHNQQKGKSSVTGNIIFECLEDTNTLEICFGLRYGLAIKDMGIKVFHRLFGEDNVIFLWQSAIECRNGKRSVPYLLGYNTTVGIAWCSFDNYWGSHYPSALRREVTLSHWSLHPVHQLDLHTPKIKIAHVI